MNKFKKTKTIEQEGHTDPEQARRKFLKTAGKFAIYTPPTVMMLMKPGYARMNKSIIGRPYDRGNNGIGNGLDPQPPGMPKPNDTPGIHRGRRPRVEDR